MQRADDWNDDKLRRERELYEGCVRRKALAQALGSSVAQLAGMLLPDTMRLLGRSTFSAFCLTLGVLSVAVVFPSDIQSPTSSRRYVLPLTICTSVVTVGNAMRALINVEHINDSCRFVHVLLCVGVVLNAIVCITR